VYLGNVFMGPDFAFVHRFFLADFSKYFKGANVTMSLAIANIFFVSGLLL